MYDDACISLVVLARSSDTVYTQHTNPNPNSPNTNTYSLILIISLNLVPPIHRYHIALVISLSIPAPVLEHWALSAMAGVMVVCGLLVVMVPVQYNRR